MQQKTILFFVLNVCAFRVLCEIDPPKIITKRCEDNFRSCQECMSADPECLWISVSNLNNTNIRCTTIDKVPLNLRDTVVPNRQEGEPLITKKDKAFRLPSGDDKPAIQIRPQEIKLYLRKDVPVTFKLKYKALKNYPLDIYYLLDQTYSMGKHRDNLRDLGGRLAEDLANLTTDYRIAFGYFSDKVRLPYYATAQKILENPCLVVEGVDECMPGSNFVHALDFTSNVSLFSARINPSNFNFTANLDDLEGGMDALMQIILCKREFGWRTHSRRLVIFATDGFIHTAGDGLLGGVVRKLDQKKCMVREVNGRHVYDGLTYDYPSVEEIYRNLLTSKMVVLFAVQQKDKKNDVMVEYYNSLRKLMPEVSYMSVLKEDAQDIVDMISEGYRDVVKRVYFNVVDQPEHLEITSTSNCGNKRTNDTWGCWNVEQSEQIYTFEITVRLKHAPHKRKENISIEEMHIHESLRIEIEYPEYCTCDEESHSIGDAETNGRYSCGVFICNSGWAGEKCDKKCDRSSARFKNATYISTTCSSNGFYDEEVCRCVCDSMFSGEFCEYPQCERDAAGQMCSGHGRCERGECNCEEDYSGERCECLMSTDACMSNGFECSRHGHCECGQCECDRNETRSFRYFGKYCQFCDGCHTCLYSEVLSRHLAGTLRQTDGYVFEEGAKEKLDFDCNLEYAPNSTYSCLVEYTYDGDSPVVISYHRTCTSHAGFYVRAGSGIAGVLFLLLFLPIIIWKIMSVVKDRKEVANFNKELLGQTSQSNRLYKSPVTEYRNPNCNQG